MSARSSFLVALILGLGLLLPAPARADDEVGPLAELGRLVGGQWWLDNGYQVFEWGVGKRSIRARSYRVADGGPRLVGEGLWYRHPEDGSIRGIFTAEQMPVVLFEYVGRMEGATLVAELAAYAGNGQRTELVERWAFDGEDRYEWTLLGGTPEQPMTMMSGVFERRPAESPPEP